MRSKCRLTVGSFVWTVVVTATIIVVTAWLKRRNFYDVQGETETNNEVGECETQKSIELIEGVWVRCVATFLSAHETLRLRAAAVPINTENLCGEFEPLFFFLLKHMQAD